MRQMEYIKAHTPEEFATEYNKTCRKISTLGKVVEQFVISSTQMHIFYEMADEPIERTSQRFCCECINYEWGRSCPYREGRVDIKDHACEYFNMEISEVQS